jgi:hypothetical protein
MNEWMDLIPGSPFFRPNWRWELASWMVATGRKSVPGIRDRWVDRALRYLSPEGGRRDLVVKDAARLAQLPTSYERSLLEAYLLTGEPLPVVADRCSMSLKTVEAYTRLFCDVQPRLHARDWIASRVIGPGLWAGFTKQDIGSLWKAFAYYAGVLALEVVVTVSIEDGLVDGASITILVRRPAIDERLRQSVRLAIAASMLPPIMSLKQTAVLQDQLARHEKQARQGPEPLIHVEVEQILASTDNQVLPPPDSVSVVSVA